MTDDDKVVLRHLTVLLHVLCVLSPPQKQKLLTYLTMWTWITLLVGVLIAVGMSYVHTKLDEIGVDPVAVKLPDLPEWPTSAAYGDNPVEREWYHNLTGRIEVIGSTELVGPESLVLASASNKTFLFMGLGDGRIARMEQHPDDDRKQVPKPQWVYLTRTGSYDVDDGHCNGVFSASDVAEKEWECGRPLGMIVVKRSSVDPEFNSITEGEEESTEKTDEDVLIVADAYFGLLMVTNIFHHNSTNVKVVTLAIGAEDDEDDYTFRLLNAVVQDPSDGSLYITETSQTFQRRRIFHAIFDGRPNGRLLRYTKDEEGEGTVRVVANNLFMPNGITLSHSKSELLIVCGVTIQRYSLTKQRMLPSDNAFARVLPGSGDNIRMMKHLPTGDAADCYWVGLGSKFAQPFSLLKLTSEMPWLKSFLIALLPYSTIVDLIPKLSALAIYDTDGELIELYQDESGVFPWVSEGESFDNYLYLGSWYNNGLARVRMDENQ